MWNEQSADIAFSAKHAGLEMIKPEPALVAEVEAGSIGEEIGCKPGDRLLSINGTRPRDLIDYRYLVVEEVLDLEIIDSKGVIHKVSLEKDLDQGLGLVFTEALFDGLRQCNNNCSFCFIDQQPSGRRKSLYLKDDDFRLSFLYGSYLTLTNLKDSDWKRIEQQRLSPLFVSVHSTDPSLRADLLKNPRASLFLEQLDWFAKRNLQIHAQVVVCPGLNDGDSLERTLKDLSKYAKGDWPTVLSTAVVPVGLTRFRPKHDGLIPVDSNCARAVINQLEPLQNFFFEQLGTRFAWLSDEWYLIAGMPLPERNVYESFPQQENGVGSIRAFLESMEQATSSLPIVLDSSRSCSWVVGKLVEEALYPSVQKLNAIEGLSLKLYGLTSPYWGQEQVVTGLLTGNDLFQGLRGRDLGDELLLPSVMLREGESVFLDDMTLEKLSTLLHVPIRIVYEAADIVAAVISGCKEAA